MVSGLFDAAIDEGVFISGRFGELDLFDMPFWPAKPLEFRVDRIKQVLDGLELRRVGCILNVS